LIAWFAERWSNLGAAAFDSIVTGAPSDLRPDWLLSYTMLEAVKRKCFTHITRYGVTTSVNKTRAGVRLNLAVGRQGLVTTLIIPLDVTPVVIDALLEAGR
jgi:hypothetical protein